MSNDSLYHATDVFLDQFPFCDDVLVSEPQDPDLPRGVLHPGQETRGQVQGTQEEASGEVSQVHRIKIRGLRVVLLEEHAKCCHHVSA